MSVGKARKPAALSEAARGQTDVSNAAIVLGFSSKCSPFASLALC